jgi:hypothetical protein
MGLEAEDAVWLLGEALSIVDPSSFSKLPKQGLKLGPIIDLKLLKILTPSKSTRGVCSPDKSSAFAILKYIEHWFI